MSSYEKFTLKTIKERLESGVYANLTGANRAIGKTSELSAKDKEKAKAMAAAHFGVDLSAPKKASKKTAKKGAKKAAAATKKATKKAAKKAAPRAKKTAKAAPKKASKKAGRRKAPKAEPAAAPAPSPVAAPAAAKKGRRAGEAPAAPAPAKRTRVLHSPVVGSDSVLQTAGSVIATVDQALKSMETAKHLFPKAELEASVGQATDAIGKAVRLLNNEVLAPMLPPEDSKKAAPSPGKNKSKKGKRAKATSAASEETVDISSTPGDEDEGDSADTNGASELSPAELEQLELAQKTKPEAARLAGVTS